MDFNTSSDTAHTASIAGHTCMIPNVVLDAPGFYISYNDRDVAIYGSDTTALVRGQMEDFYVLAGDHRAAYQALLPNGFEDCYKYFLDNIDRIARVRRPT